MSDKKILIMLPTYNERDNVTTMCQKISAVDISGDVLFIDDNSPDGTGSILKERAKKNNHIFVIERSGKLGIGSAHIDGIRWAYSQGYSHLITMDCDFTHSPENIPTFLEYAEDFDIIVGSRHIRENSLQGWNPWRKFLTLIAHLLTQVLLNMPYDATGAFRLYRLDKIPIGVFDRISSRGYSFFFESLTILNLNRFSIKEIPITLPPRSYGRSKMKVNDMVYCLIFMFRMAWNIRVEKQKFLLK